MQQSVCQKSYLKDIFSYGPPANATWRVHKSSQLTIGIHTCGIEAVNDTRTLAQVYPDLANLFRDADFAFCNQHLSKCTQNCQRGFNQEMIDFRNQDD
jgi:hypothetical protein